MFKLNIVSFTFLKSSKSRIYALKKFLTGKQWNIDVIENPEGLRFCFTAANILRTDELIKDLKEV